MLRDKDFLDLGFKGDNVLGYTKGSVVVSIIEDEDCLDRYFVRGVRVRTVEELNLEIHSLNP